MTQSTGRTSSPKRVPEVPISDRRLLKAPDVAALSSMSLTKVERLIATGEIPSVQVGGNRLVRRDDLDAYIASLPSTGPTAAA